MKTVKKISFEKVYVPKATKPKAPKESGRLLYRAM